MPDDVKVRVKMFEEAKDFNRLKQETESSTVQYEVPIAKIEMEFPEFDAALAKKDGLRKELQTLFQRLADERFGREGVTVEVELHAGSFIVVAILAIGTGGYKFFKDYEQIHKGVVVFVKDLEAAKKKVEEIIRKYKG